MEQPALEARMQQALNRLHSEHPALRAWGVTRDAKVLTPEEGWVVNEHLGAGAFPGTDVIAYHPPGGLVQFLTEHSIEDGMTADAIFEHILVACEAYGYVGRNPDRDGDD